MTFSKVNNWNCRIPIFFLSTWRTFQLPWLKSWSSKFILDLRNNTRVHLVAFLLIKIVKYEHPKSSLNFEPQEITLILWSITLVAYWLFMLMLPSLTEDYVAESHLHHKLRPNPWAGKNQVLNNSHMERKKNRF